MSSESSTSRSGSATPDPAAEPRTIADNGAAAYATYILPQQSSVPTEAGLGKLERDLAFAVAIVQSGSLAERDLTRAVANWTVHGVEPLSERLQRGGWITKEDATRAQSSADRQLQTLDRSVAETSRELTGTQAARARLLQIDRSGRLARILGLAGDVTFMEAPEFRQIASRYTLIRKLGEGGLGVVWLARDENLNRYVAVKEIKASGAQDPAAVARFRREAEITGRLEHPGIVPLYQFGQDAETGRYFYVMRFLGRQTLADGIREHHERREEGHENPILLHRLLNSFVSLCHAVAHAHEQDIVHRDLKPENVALDGLGKVILLDWGLARLNNETGVYDVAGRPEPADVLESSVSGSVLGTPMYMAPEQASGRSGEVDERTDVYGLGGVLFAILTGAAPHESVTTSASTRSPLSEILTAIVEKPTQNARSLVPSVAPELDAICAKALSKKRFLRYPTAVALADDVERYLAGARVEAYQERPARKAARWMKEHPRLSQALGVLLIALLITAVTLGVAAQQTQVVIRQARFELIRDVADELKLTLLSQADALVRNSRFIGGLPTTASVAGAVLRVEREGVAPDAEIVTPAAPNTTAPQVLDDLSLEEWKERLGVVYEGLLRGNPEYRVVALAQVSAGRAREVIRFEQNFTTRQVYELPSDRLREFPLAKLQDELAQMMPGEVMLTTGDQVSPDAPARDRSPLTLIALTPVYEPETGTAFGFFAIEMDLQRILRTRVASIARGLNIWITDAAGNVQMHCDSSGQFNKSDEGVAVAKVLPGTAPLFAGSRPAASVTVNNRIYGLRTPLNPLNYGPDCDVGLIVAEPSIAP